MTDRLRLLDATEAEAAEQLRRAGIRASLDELRAVARRLGRDLTPSEAFFIDVAYSEHCSYKSSRRFLRALLPPLPSHVVLGPGEDAGVVDLGVWNGKRYALVVAHESHNHPSQLLPVEGAATGIGGIVRDVYCMGADVIGVLDGLRFGDLDGPRGEIARSVARGVVRGIWEYGNALGVPNLGGDVDFDPCYDDNCLVNVVAVGIAPLDRILRSRVPEEAAREPYEIVLVGKPTDRSGLGGASFASQILDSEAAERNLGAVQIHDPFLKRVLVEATRAVCDLLAERGCAAGFKDLGAGGFGGASSELAVAGGFGLEIDLSRLPAADPAIAPEHLLVGETQERFVWALPSRVVPEVLALYNDTFDLPGVYPGACAASLGRVTTEKRYRVLWRDDLLLDLPFDVVRDTPVLTRPTRPRAVEQRAEALRVPADWASFVAQLLGHPSLCGRQHIYRHYDAEVRGEALLRPGEADAGLCRPIPDCTLGVAVSMDGKARACDLDPYQGAAATVLEAVRNVVAVGARPRALTDCMNFGSPEDPECLWEFEQALRGMRDACVALGLPEDRTQPLPIVSGNVSFYNQSAGGRRIRPTPIVACFGALHDWRRSLRPQMTREGRLLHLVADLQPAYGGSPALDLLGGVSVAPRHDLQREGARAWAVLGAIEQGLVTACHDFAEGGLLVGAIETLFREEGPTGRGLDLDLTKLGLRPEEALLSESGGFLLEVDPDQEATYRRLMEEAKVETVLLGQVLAEPRFRVRANGRALFDLEVRPLWEKWAGKLGPWIEGMAI